MELSPKTFQDKITFTQLLLYYSLLTGPNSNRRSQRAKQQGFILSSSAFYSGFHCYIFSCWVTFNYWIAGTPHSSGESRTTEEVRPHVPRKHWTSKEGIQYC